MDRKWIVGIEIFFHLLFWGTCYVVLENMLSFELHERLIINGKSEIVSKIIRYPFYYLGLLSGGIVLSYTNIFLLFPKFFLNKKYWLYGLVLILLIASIVFIETQGVYFFSLDEPGMILGKKDKLNLEGKLAVSIVFLLLSFAYIFLKEWNREQSLKQKILTEKLSTELQLLRSQVNPHFLFNTLNTLFSMAQKHRDDNTANGIAKLSKMMRYMLGSAETSLVNLEKEIDYLDNYVELMRLRFEEEDVDICFEKNGDFSMFQVHPMLLIPLVENAFKHGISSRQHSFIYVNASVGDDFEFLVKNSIGSANEDRTTSGIGLENVKKRLDLLYKNKYTLEIKKTEKIYETRLMLQL